MLESDPEAIQDACVTAIKAALEKDKQVFFIDMCKKAFLSFSSHYLTALQFL